MIPTGIGKRRNYRANKKDQWLSEVWEGGGKDDEGKWDFQSSETIGVVVATCKRCSLYQNLEIILKMPFLTLTSTINI